MSDHDLQWMELKPSVVIKENYRYMSILTVCVVLEGILQCV